MPLIILKILYLERPVNEPKWFIHKIYTLNLRAFFLDKPLC